MPYIYSAFLGVILLASCSQQAEQQNQGNHPQAEKEVALSKEARKGEALFSQNCVQCHNLSKNPVIGPGLAGVTTRLEKDFLIKFIRNSQEVIKSGDKYAVQLFKAYNQTLMPSYNFNEAEMKALLQYLAEAQSK